MGENIVISYLVVLVLTCFSFIQCGEYCLTDDGRSIEYCEHGCCGDERDDQDCCTPVVWIVVGCVLGGLFIAAVLITICCVFYKKKGKPGRVVQPQGGQTALVSYTTNVNQQGYYVNPSAPPAPPPYGMNYNQYPPPYSQQNMGHQPPQQPPPPPFTGPTNPAYPPPPANYSG